MASSKKGKKNKGKTLALGDFLQETPGVVAAVPIRKSTLNWADEVEDSHDVYDSRAAKVSVVLPTAPKASRDYDDIIDKVPLDPPYIAYLSNLPYDVEESEIAYFFKNMKISNMKIPKDERTGEAPKLKGFGYVEFEDRESLLNALVMPDTTIKSRRIRIEVASDSDNDKRRGRMDMNRDRGGMRSEMSSGDWRSGPRTENADNNDRRGGFGRDRPERDREESSSSGAWRDGERRAPRDSDRGFSRPSDSGRFNRDDRDQDFGRSRGRDDRDQEISRSTRTRDDQDFGRSRDQDFSRSRGRDDRDQEISRSTRTRDDRDQDFSRSTMRDNRDQDFGRSRGGDDREGFRPRRDDRDQDFNRGRDREEKSSFMSRRFDDKGPRSGGYSRGSGNEDSETNSSEPRQRPKLVLAPRTKPVEVAASEPVSSSGSIFGNAKPVDTSARERQIEERLAKTGDPPPQRELSRERKEHSQEKEVPVYREKREKDEVREPEKKTLERTSSNPQKFDANGVVDKSHSNKRNGDHEKKEVVKGDVGEKHKNDNRKREEKKDKAEKTKKVDPPNFIASNKFAYLETEDTSD